LNVTLFASFSRLNDRFNTLLKCVQNRQFLSEAKRGALPPPRSFFGQGYLKYPDIAAPNFS
jgi:hypothetical protein